MFETQRWSAGVVCPPLWGQAIEKRERSENGLQRYNCQSCAQAKTDEYAITNFATEADYDHRTVNHGQAEYARPDPDGTQVHCNTTEGIWTGLRCFLRRFVGVSQKFLHLRLARFEFLFNHRHLDPLQRFQSALQLSFQATADYWRQMVKKHRRIPLTPCYR